MAVTRTSDAFIPAKPAGPVRRWVSRHFATAGDSLGRLVRQPFASLMTVLVISVTLALPAAAHLIIKNVQSLSGNWDNALDFSLYLEAGMPAEEAVRLAGVIGQRADIQSVTLIPADEALEEVKLQSGFGPAPDNLSVHPLPHTIVVRRTEERRGGKERRTRW